MNKKTNEVSVTFRISKIYVSEFSLNEDYLSYPPDALAMTINHKISIGVGKNGDEARVAINAKFYEQKARLSICSMTCVSVFTIENIKNYAVGKHFELPDVFLIAIGSIGYTHTRAIMSQHAQGYFMLPMIDPVEVFGKSTRQVKKRSAQARKNKKTKS